MCSFRSNSLMIFKNSTDYNINCQTISKRDNLLIYTVNPAHAVTCIKRSPFPRPVMEYFISIEPLLSGHLSYQATFSLPPKRPLNIGLTVCKKNSIKNRY